MRVYELAYCCYAYACLERYDQATVDLRAATGGAVDPGDEHHLGPLFEWLRRWGCRQFKIEDEDLARESLVEWWGQRSSELPCPDQTLDEMDDDALGRIAEAYDDLRRRPASVQRRADGSVSVSFGPAGAAKTLYAIRPNSCSPWDEPIREQLGLSDDGEGYRRHLIRIRAELAEVVADLGPGGTASQLPSLLGRDDSSPVKLIDEHNWIRWTRGFGPPSPDTLVQWASWAQNSPP